MKYLGGDKYGSDIIIELERNIINVLDDKIWSHETFFAGHSKKSVEHLYLVNYFLILLDNQPVRLTMARDCSKTIPI